MDEGLLLENVPGSLVVVDESWRVTLANAAAERLLGRSEGALLGKLLWEEFPGLAGTALERAYRHVMSERVAVTVDGLYPDSGRWYEVHVYPTASPARGISLYFHDASRQLRAEEALHQRSALLQAISDSSGDVIYAKDREGRLQFANPATLALVGKPAERVLGRTDAEFLDDPEAARVVMENDRRIMESGVAVDVDEPVPLPDGTKRIWLSRKAPHRDAKGRIIGLLGVSRDVTDQRRAWKRLRGLYDVVAALSEVPTVEELARVTLEQGIVALGATAGSLSLVAESGDTMGMVGMVGYPPESVERWRSFRLDAPVPLADAVSRGEPVFIQSAAERLARYPDLKNLRSAAETRSSACLPLIIAGKAVGVIGLSFDSEGIFSEEDRDFLLSLSRQCAQALDRIRLFDGERRARERAEDASRMKDEFLATLSHELRTPLNAILGWTTIVMDQVSSDPGLAKGVATIQRNARSQARIIDDLLDMSGIVNGKVRLQLQRCDVAQILDEAIESIGPSVQAKGTRLRAAIDPDAGSVNGDPARLQQVFWNLLTNAVKFTPRGGEVRVELVRADAQVQIRVADTGEGIAGAFLPHVFDPFRQADGAMTRRHGGLGLGLAITKQLVELQGGSIAVSSRGVGMGATFTVTLPSMGSDRQRALPESDRPPAALPAREKTAAARLELTGLRVLVVDDESDARALLEELLGGRGAIVSSASSAAEGMASIELQAPDVVISDIGMPDEDGYAFVRKIRARGGAPLPCVALTAFAGRQDRVRALREGFYAHLAKPVDFDELIVVLASVSGRISV